jgi:multidrug efflux pump subunit AcrB
MKLAIQSNRVALSFFLILNSSFLIFSAYTPLARAVIGGLAVSALQTIFLVPAAYLLIHGKLRIKN